ncbi:MAG: hypothetical protein EOP49_00470 [Sphingobacteriales bacterium]|nr:MAG: hypothetical protein EOP49_00470 [Sphingobacteriales bacterium]
MSPGGPSLIPVGYFPLIVCFVALAFLIRQMLGLLRNASDGSVRMRWRAILAICTILTFAGAYTVFRITYSEPELAGYHITSRWEWLDTSYGYRPVYKGEWACQFFLIIFPLLSASLCMFLLPNKDHRAYLKLMASWYPLALLLSYAFIYLFSGIEFPVYEETWMQN